MHAYVYIHIYIYIQGVFSYNYCAEKMLYELIVKFVGYIKTIECKCNRM